MRTFSTQFMFFCLVGTRWKDFLGQVLWHLWIGGAWKPEPSLQHVAVEVFFCGRLAYAWGLGS